MLTFLEYVCERLMGPPVYGSSWRCPFHDDNTPSFNVRPPKQRANGSWYPIKFCCHACHEFGDEWDMLLRFYPNATKQQMLGRLNKLRYDYKKLTGRDAPYPIPGKRGQDSDALKLCTAELRSVLRERRCDWSQDEAALRMIVWASHIAVENGIPLEALARHCASELIALHGNRKVKPIKRQA